MTLFPKICPNIIIADDHPATRSGVRYFLKNHFPVIRVREAEDGDQILALYKESPADVVIMDLNMPDTDPQGLVRTLLTLYPSLHILIFSMYKEEIFGPMYYKLGIKGFISKMYGDAEIVKAVEAALAGDIYYRKEMQSFYFRKNKVDDPYATLTKKEKEVMRHLISGDTPVQIARILNVTITTVSSHKGNILRKLKLSNLMELKAMADVISLDG